MLRIEVRRDREGSFEPQLIGKHERRGRFARLGLAPKRLCWLDPLDFFKLEGL